MPFRNVFDPKKALLMTTEKQKKYIRIFWIIIISPVALLCLLLLFIGVFANIPSFEDLEDPRNNLATEVISSDDVILGTFHVENRTYVSYSELSPNLEQALLATEDVRFYSHSGIDFISLGRVAVKTILGGDRRSGGGSTLTQQLAKNLYPRGKTSKIAIVYQKLKEWITAVKLERSYTKQEIIAMYLNTIEFGSNAFGIRAAAVTFFGKHPSQVNIQEAAILVGVINAPTFYSPVRNPERALNRRNHVISQMSKYGYVSKVDGDSLKTLPIELSFSQQDHLSGMAPYFRDMLRRTMLATKPERSKYSGRRAAYVADSTRWAEDPIYGWIHKNQKSDGSQYNIDRDGLKIYTTIDSRMQKYAEWATEEHLKKDLQPAFSQDVRRRRNPPFSNNLRQREIDGIMRQARRWSERYRLMKAEGISESEIEKSFKVKTEMSLFSWKGDIIDTLLTPNDSILYYKSILRASLVAVESGTGYVRAYVGGPNYLHFKYDNASQGRRQVGSTMKPFLYTLAMQEGMDPCTNVLNVPQTFIIGDSTWTPKSTDKAEWIGRYVSLKWGLTNSSNNISAYLMKQYGPQAMIDICSKIGIKSDLPVVPSLALGSCDLSPLEMVGAYNTYPSKGVFIEPFFVVRIEDKDGNVLTTPSPIKREALSPQTAYLMTNLLQGVVNEGTAARLRSRYIPEGQIAGKTGTTNDQSDGWFMGYVPRLTVGVWVGAEDRSVHFESLALGGGSNMALPIWGLFMQKVLADPALKVKKTDIFDVPNNLVMNLNCDGSEGDLSSGKEQGNDDFFN